MERLENKIIDLQYESELKDDYRNELELENEVLKGDLDKMNQYFNRISLNNQEEKQKVQINQLELEIINLNKEIQKSEEKITAHLGN